MNQLLIGLVGALMATNHPLAVSNLIRQQTGAEVPIVNPADPAEKELERVMADDDAALAEIDQWIRDNEAFAAQGAGESKAELNKKIRARLDGVRAEYENFLKLYPNDARGHLAYGTFLNDIGEEDAAALQYETSRRLDPKNPAVWNNLANYYGEYGSVTNAFADYAEAIRLNPAEPVYYENFAATVYLYRKDAREFYHINEQQVFDKALELYRKAMKLDPDNFPLATDYAQSYYGIKPLRTNDALVAWTNALNVARNETEREGIYLHLARVKIAAGFFAEAAAQLDAVTNAMYADLKTRLERNLAEREKAATNSATPISSPPEISTNLLAAPTNNIPALTNPPAFPPKMADALTNVPPMPPKATDLSKSGD